ncbi:MULTISPECIES: type A chloramphenicol O-acetyltransferase [Bacillus]|uniref:type A chloramphenicol O-acetyltransferase n=1 Tax=Bacillus TaxID=1386 RepID=UPI00040651C5|nr:MULTISPECIES: type A chloramphenicol O-acetyltransferase [Bacillus]QHZ47826.1 type A chloramphenicol O-acetyltransferase [Bacillus sp. NSP9.1]WFA03905.1 type A chloramphenicol O-acetyltransferase [Bacillus sp. HSf4]
MNFKRIDLEHWHRKPYFEHFMSEGKCSFSLTANLNISAMLEVLKEQNIKLYPAFIYMVSRVVQAYPEFRTGYNEKGELGVWEQMNPCYTVFHHKEQTFSAVWTEYDIDFSRFYHNHLKDMLRFGNNKGLWAKENIPANAFSISSIPWVSFTSFNLNLANSGHLLPIITNGKFFSNGTETLLPVSLQVHHAVCDGWHAGVFMNELQRLADSGEEWLKK